MIGYLVRRILQALGLLLLVSVIGFGILHLAPGGPMAQFAASGDLTPADFARIEHQMGLDRALPIQYGEWLWRLLSGDWGVSYRDQQPVLGIIASHLGATVELMLTSMCAAILLGCWIGVISAVRRYGWFDTLATAGSMITLSIPTFWFGFMMIYIFSVRLEWLPSGNLDTIGDGSLLDHIHHLIAPAVVLALASTASWSRYMRSSMLDVINQDFVRTARAKGLPRRWILYRHIVRNALLPMITIAGLQLPSLLGGALVTETVFTWPGMGRLFLDSISYRDYPVVMGVLMFTATLVLIGSLLADLCYGLADPRISLR
jgi:peptide/nickel transport system permease protein